MTFHSPLLRAFTPKQLFRAGEKGVWYDPSDMSTLWQDSARTTAVTAVEQPVGCIDDKSGNGVNATQSTSASRPVLSARVNLLTKTEQFDHADWTKNNVTVTADATTAPNGTVTADALYETATTGFHRFYQTATVSITNGVTYKCSMRVKYNGRKWIALQLAQGWCYFDVETGATGNKSATVSGETITSDANGFWKCEYTDTVSAASFAANPIVYLSDVNGGTPSNTSYLGDVTKGIYIWGADLRVSNDGVGLPAYQRVNTSTDYDTSGFPMYLRFDGTDDSLVTGSIDFTATNKLTWWVGERKLSDAATAVIAEIGNGSTDKGFFNFYYLATSANYGFGLTGSGSGANRQATTFTAPISNVASVALDIGASGLSNQIQPRVNGTIPTLADTGTVGSGNFGNLPLYIGRRAGSSLPFNGRLYSLLVRGASSTAGQISDTEGWVNSRTKAYS